MRKIPNYIRHVNCSEYGWNYDKKYMKVDNKSVLKKINFFLFFNLLQINIFLVFLNYFDVLMSKIIFLK
jgi:hypothetical protein